MKMTVELVLFCVFLTLKLTGLIGWSWWWVTAPLWIPAALSLAVVLIALTAVVAGAKNMK